MLTKTRKHISNKNSPQNLLWEGQMKEEFQKNTLSLLFYFSVVITGIASIYLFGEYIAIYGVGLIIFQLLKIGKNTELLGYIAKYGLKELMNNRVKISVLKKIKAEPVSRRILKNKNFVNHHNYFKSVKYKKAIIRAETFLKFLSVFKTIGIVEIIILLWVFLLMISIQQILGIAIVIFIVVLGNVLFSPFIAFFSYIKTFFSLRGKLEKLYYQSITPKYYSRISTKKFILYKK